MKKIDKLLVKSFLPPFFLSFLIALFVLVMQTLYIYLDDFIGKGLGLFVMVEMISYLSIKLFPLALAIGVLLASVMVFGNMGEKYELSSFKSAGVSLFRIMKPLIILVTLISAFSYLCNDYLNPKANLQFHSRMWDIRRQKPALSIDERIFNDDFFGTSIWITEKEPEKEGIEGVLIHNQNSSNNNIDALSAADGTMRTSPDGRYFIMTLHDGEKYVEMYRETKNGKVTYPFLRTEFKTWRKAFDLDEFELNMTDQDLFKSHQYMKTSNELVVEIDSFRYQLGNLTNPLDIRFRKMRNMPILVDSDPLEELPEAEISTKIAEEVAKREGKSLKNQLMIKADRIIKDSSENKPTLDPADLEDLDELPIRRLQQPAEPGNYAIPEELPTRLEDFHSQEELRYILSIATTSARNTQFDISKVISEKKRLNVDLEEYQFELHSKFSLALACLIFLFIGAPMGAIVRKGGFGYPLLISILFFSLYIITSIAMKKMVEELKVDGVLGAWYPTLGILVIGLFLTVRAMNDSKMMNIDYYFKGIIGLFKRMGLSNSG